MACLVVHLDGALTRVAAQNYARAMTKLDFNTPNEKDTVQMVYGAHFYLNSVVIRNSETAVPRWRDGAAVGG